MKDGVDTSVLPDKSLTEMEKELLAKFQVRIFIDEVLEFSVSALAVCVLESSIQTKEPYIYIYRQTFVVLIALHYFVAPIYTFIWSPIPVLTGPNAKQLH